ncbi:proton-coupled folate transporter [Plakobranchus ocellatus]|uniref:Proton-coupled folate transporter n=1 Tax=Plakobranchus ocellatus TaxID=259542 RepID=A0AAV4BBW1_9GAST|nr:proton-coupled folate transporter [Plakobranchus ocellatus]
MVVLHRIHGRWSHWLLDIADTNPDKKDRAFWAAVLGTSVAIVSALLLVINGVFIDQLGFFAASLMSAASASVAFLLAFLFFPETLPSTMDKKLEGWDSVKRIGSYFFLGGSLRERLTLWTCLFIFMFSVVCQLIRITIDSLYLLHRPFCWTHSIIGIFSGSRMAGTFLVGIVILRIFRSCCQPEILAMVGLLFQTAGFVLQALARKSWQLILVPVVTSPCTVAVPVIRAILSTLASPADQGALNSSVAVVEVVINLAGTVGVLSVYSATLAGPLPGAVYLLMASFGAAAFLLYFDSCCTPRKCHFGCPSFSFLSNCPEICRDPTVAGSSPATGALA